MADKELKKDFFANNLFIVRLSKLLNNIMPKKSRVMQKLIDKVTL